MTVRLAKTQISLGIRPVWSESSLCAQWVAKEPGFFMRAAKTDQTGLDAQADLSLRWAHISFCWFCHEAAHLVSRAGCGIRLYRFLIIAFSSIYIARCADISCCVVFSNHFTYQDTLKKNWKFDMSTLNVFNIKLTHISDVCFQLT